MPPSTRPSISQITFPSLLEVRTPIAFSYLGNYTSIDLLAHKHLEKHQKKTPQAKTASRHRNRFPARARASCCKHCHSSFCPSAPHKTAPHSTLSTSVPNCVPLRQIVKTQKCTRACTSTPNCMPPSTLPSIWKRCARTAISTSNSTPISTYTSTPNCCMPPSTSPSISQITFPSLLEVRTPIAFSYLGNYSFQLSGELEPLKSGKS